MNPPRSLLTVMAHADDAELWAGGTLAHHAATGTHVTIALPRTGTIRDHEAANGATTLGAHLHLLDQLTTDAIENLLTTLRPEVVITHHPHDIHPDHQAAARTLLAAIPTAVITTGHPQRAYTSDSYNNLDQHGQPLHLPTIIDITHTWATKITALNAHTSQPITTHFGPMAETLAHLHGHRINRPHAEAFHPVPILGALPATTYL